MKKVAEVLDGLRDEERQLSIELSGVRRAIAALEEVMGIGPEQVTEATAPGQSALPPNAPPPSDPPGPYALDTFYEAAVAYLTAAGEPRTTREIAEALQAGGYPTRAANFVATVRTMLHRNAKAYGIYPAETGGRWFARD